MVVEDLDPAEIRGWAVGLSALHQRIAQHFVRAEPQQLAYDYLRALLGRAAYHKALCRAASGSVFLSGSQHHVGSTLMPAMGATIADFHPVLCCTSMLSF